MLCDINVVLRVLALVITDQGLVLLKLSWDKNWDSHSLVNGYPIFYPRIALVAPSLGNERVRKQTGRQWKKCKQKQGSAVSLMYYTMVL